MNNELCIDAEKNEINFEDNKSDKSVVVLLKAALGNVPVVGSILSEVVGILIPNQKTDRVKVFIEVLAQKVDYIEKDILEVKMKSEKFTDLLEDALPQAARALTNERREYIVTFLKNSLETDDINHIGEKKLLAILNELNDAEVIFLKYDALYESQEKDEFYELHEKVLEPIGAAMNSPKSEFEKMYLRKSYQDKLADLGLTTTTFKKPKKGEMPEMDEKTGKMKSSYHNASGLGRMLLSYIDDTYVNEAFEN